MTGFPASIEFMPNLYPLLMLSDFRERVWGTRDLSRLYPYYPTGDHPIGEVWLTGDENRVANGPLAGQTLADTCAAHSADLLGETYGNNSALSEQSQSRFPLLMKFIFPVDRLSVQVHPDDEAAQKVGLPCGKTECWYVVDAAPGARIALGLKPGTIRAQVESAMVSGSFEGLLNWTEIHAGEMYYIDAGTVHCISAGSVLLETQQNSDTTYRLYDYGRGRELHVERALDCMKISTHAGRVMPHTIENKVTLVSAPRFVVEKFDLKNVLELSTGAGSGRSSVQVLVALAGCGVVEAADAQPVSFAQGQAVIIPAAIGRFTVKPQWTLEFVRASLPLQPVAEPDTQPVAS